MYVLHYAPDNASLIIRLVLEELGQPYRTALVDRAARAQDAPAYRAVNPTGLIPALETPQGPVFETGAILLWLAEVHGALAPPPGHPDRPGFLTWLLFTSNTLHADIRLHFYPAAHSGDAANLPAFRRATEARILRHLALLNAAAESRPALFDAASVLGWYVATLCRWLALYPTDRRGWFDLTAFPALHQMARTLQDRPAALRAARAEGLGPTIFTAPRSPLPPEGSVF